MNLPPPFYTETVTRTVHHLNSPYYEITMAMTLIAVLVTILGFATGLFPGRAGGRP